MKKKKVLIAANWDSFIFKFLIPNLKMFHENGYEVHVASNGNTKVEDIPYCDKKFNVCFTRNLLNKDNIISYRQIKRIIEDEDYDLIHCHTPFGAAITRMAARKTRKNGNLKVIYTAHGFHFFKGAPMKNWLLFYPAEKILANYTDVLITINQEDYELARSKFKTKVKYVPGVGIDNKKFDFRMTSKEKQELRKSLGIEKDDVVLIYPAELSKRKNQLWLLETLKEYLQKNKNVKLLLPGNDILNGKCQKYAKENQLDNVLFLGFRKDIPKLLRISDISVSSSKQEGLPVNIMEAMYVGLPIIATDCRGQRDLMENGKNGYIISSNDQNTFVLLLQELVKDSKKRTILGKESQKMIKRFLLENVMNDMSIIYREVK